MIDEQIITPGQLHIFAQQWHRQNLKIVLTNGCFDIFHAGHLKTFIEAKKYGDILIVGINSDESVRVLKGETRPIISEHDRSLMIAALKPVDYVTIFNEANACNLIEIIKPHIYVKGGDYKLDSLPEKDSLLRQKVDVKFIPLVAGISTSIIIEKIKNANI
ncbi:MAG TPA: adenylyltransferase/cytidyltransferase family protein [Bacillota bacterium]|jgi:rfaE bifunctional protein nucleotidyltransferase chain/domain|nr:adenylyltransferase/cytidyltransferase family protein [Bacillota bacterium]HOL08707.1 adenylyltransferase/cytidyltransferase family protein [Bacillota bacterium]HPO96390.1 adenylyltransferase/cytidyltransferase family protein [Bacillota bacterium]